LALAESAVQNPPDIEPRLNRLVNMLKGMFVGVRDSRLWDDRQPKKRSVDFGELAAGVEGHSRFTPLNRVALIQTRDTHDAIRSYAKVLHRDVLERNGWAPRERIETISPYQARTDLPLANGQLLVIEVDPLEEIPLSRILVAIGATASVGATLIRAGLYSIHASAMRVIQAS
jgi:hypothetical protein